MKQLQFGMAFAAAFVLLAFFGGYGVGKDIAVFERSATPLAQ